MGAHVVFMGPSTAGKSELMLGLSRLERQSYDFQIDRHWTTRARRVNTTYREGDEENIFVTPEAFDAERSEFLFTFHTYGTYEYGVPPPAPVREREARLRILQPIVALRFRRLVPEPAVLCAVLPFPNDPSAVMFSRDHNANPLEVRRRLIRFDDEIEEAVAVADVRFQNTPGLPAAVLALRDVLVEYLREHDL